MPAFKISVFDQVFKATEGLSGEFDVIYLLSQAIWDSRAYEVDGVFSLESLGIELLVMDGVVIGSPLFDPFSVPVDGKAIAGLGDSFSGGVIEW